MYESPHHEYSPEWDYEIDEEPLDDVVKLVDQVLKLHEQEGVFLGLELRPAHVFYVTGLEEERHLAKYISGTSEDPFIVLDLRYLEATAFEYGVRLLDEVESTLLHEYGHAYMEATGRHDEMSAAREERIVEKFAKTYWKTRDLKKAIKVLVS
jgi:hypothetical protein